MPGRRIQPAFFPGNSVENRSRPYKTAETFKGGALLVIDANGELTECGADPAVVDAVALEAVGTKPGWQMANSPTVITGRVQETSAVMANSHTIFSMRGVNGGTDPVTPAVTNIDEEYGVAKDGSGIWTLDLAETSAKVFKIVDIDIDNKIFFCRFLASVIV
jgi:hypothetical protein